MRHIDNMSKLREAVAFEWYAQRNPLIVYKERAFEKFEELISEIDYKITKSIFSVKVDLEIRQMEINENDFIVNNPEEILEKSNIEPQVLENKNPLFNSTKPINKDNSWKTKIRV